MIDKPSPAEIQAERAQAMQEYQAELDAVKARTAKLRAERMAREASGEFIKPVKAPKPIATDAAPKPARVKTKAPAKKTAKIKPAIKTAMKTAAE